MATHDASPRQTLVDVATLAALMAAWLYVMGWTYALHYFRRFEVGLIALDIPYEYYLMYGTWVVKDWWWVGVIVALLALIGCFWRPVRAMTQGVATALLVGLAIAAFCLAPSLGRRTAHQHYEAWSAEAFKPYPRVKIWLKQDAKDLPEMQEMAKALPQGCHRLLLQSKSILSVFRPRAGVSQLQLSVMTIPLSEVRSMRVMPQYDSCP